MTTLRTDFVVVRLPAAGSGEFKAGLPLTVLDCRTWSEEEISANVTTIADALCSEEIVQIWLETEKEKFLEIRGRLTKMLLPMMNQLSCILGKLSIQERSTDDASAYSLGRAVFELFVATDRLEDVLEAHPGLVRNLRWAMKRVTARTRNGAVKYGKKEGDSNNEDDNDQNKRLTLKRKMTMSYDDNRRPSKRTFHLLKHMRKDDTAPPSSSTYTSQLHQEQQQTPNSRRCYTCKRPKCNPSTDDPMCTTCRSLNETMKTSKADLSGRYAVVTGARIKIGYEVAVRLRRDGCHVVATTRFPGDALKRYKSEADYEEWKVRLVICALDLEDFGMITIFVSNVEETLPHLDILVNNAAQTISRPAPYYKALYRSEAEFRPAVEASKQVAPLAARQSAASARDLQSLPAQLMRSNSENPDFPTNVENEYGEQVDLRTRNSWTYNLDEVPVVELLQVLSINTVGPFILTSKLKKMLVKSPAKAKFVVNVSAMEGQFSRVSKGHRHPHTNMAKAALNMLTRTAGLEYQMDGIYMTAADTGWVTDKRPFRQAAHEAETKGFAPPLDCKDGAARVYHPILEGIIDEEKKPFLAVFLKDFKVHPW